MALSSPRMRAVSLFSSTKVIHVYLRFSKNCAVSILLFYQGHILSVYQWKLWSINLSFYQVHIFSVYLNFVLLPRSHIECVSVKIVKYQFVFLPRSYIQCVSQFCSSTKVIYLMCISKNCAVSILLFYQGHILSVYQWKLWSISLSFYQGHICSVYLNFVLLSRSYIQCVSVKIVKYQFIFLPRSYIQCVSQFCSTKVIYLMCISKNCAVSILFFYQVLKLSVWQGKIAVSNLFFYEGHILSVYEWKLYSLNSFFYQIYLSEWISVTTFQSQFFLLLRSYIVNVSVKMCSRCLFFYKGHILSVYQ